MRLTEAEFDALLAQRAVKKIAEHEKKATQRVARARSKLESELAGHLHVMGLTPEREFRFHPTRKWRFDFAFPEQKIAVEINGGIFRVEQGKEAGRHSRGAGLVKEYEKLNAAVELGWRVLLFGPPQVSSGAAALQIERLVRLPLLR